MRCYNCNTEGLECHSNWPATRILINPHTQAPHVCNRNDIIITKGKWRGVFGVNCWTVREANQISLNQERIHSQYLAKLRQQFESPYGEKQGANM